MNETCICSHPSKHKTFVWHLYNAGPTSKTLGRRCINVIQMFCVFWDITTEIWITRKSIGRHNFHNFTQWWAIVAPCGFTSNMLAPHTGSCQCQNRRTLLSRTFNYCCWTLKVLTVRLQYNTSKIQCRAVPCRAVPCRAVPCRAVQCSAVSCVQNSNHFSCIDVSVVYIFCHLCIYK